MITQSSWADTKYAFDIPQQSADKALTQFAKQANITLLFPLHIAEKEIVNALKGEYTVELGIVKLLESTGLYPYTDESGLSVRAIVNI